jgi:hypothetical protein
MPRSYSDGDLTGYPSAVVDDPGVYRYSGYHYRTSIDGGTWGGYPALVLGGSTKRKRQSRRGRKHGMGRRARSHKQHKPKKPAPVHVHPEPSIPGVNAPGKATAANTGRADPFLIHS